MIDFSQSVLLVEMMVFLEKLRVDCNKEEDKEIKISFLEVCGSVEVLISKLKRRVELNKEIQSDKRNQVSNNA